ncbi:hypothetical protein [Aestuariivirga sp.]|uniref:hypothetical protein n=1 Tax=Aestuariivirga sp. TaxID=2650926 RepID=UPI0039E3170D
MAGVDISRSLWIGALILITAVTPAKSDWWEGFKPIAELDPKLRGIVERSVVFIQAPAFGGELKEADVEIVDVQSRAISRNVRPSKDPRKPQSRQVMEQLQVETCRKQNLRYCPIFEQQSRSTGLLEDGSILNTCRHGFHNWLLMAMKANPGRTVQSITPPLIIYSLAGKVLYNSANVEAKELLKITMIDDSPKFEKPFDQINDLANANVQSNGSLSDYFAESRRLDYVELTSPDRIAQPEAVIFDTGMLSWGNDPITLVGFSAKTNFYGDLRLDAPGAVAVATSGDISHLYPNDLYFTAKMPAQHGLSGGPVFNKYGEVMGIIIDSIDPSDVRENGWQSGFLVLDKAKLRERWKARR